MAFDYTAPQSHRLDIAYHRGWWDQLRDTRSEQARQRIGRQITLAIWALFGWLVFTVIRVVAALLA